MLENTMRQLLWLCLMMFLTSCGYKSPLKQPEPVRAPQIELPQKQ